MGAIVTPRVQLVGSGLRDTCIETAGFYSQNDFRGICRLGLSMEEGVP